MPSRSSAGWVVGVMASGRATHFVVRRHTGGTCMKSVTRHESNAMESPTRAPDHLVDREPELRALEMLIGSGEARCVSLVGPHGVGKTVLADHAVRRIREFDIRTIHWVGLGREAAESADGSLESVLAGVTGQGGPLHAAGPTLGRLRVVVVDAADAVTAAAPAISSALGKDPWLTVVTTAIAPLVVPGEYVFEVRSLELASAGVRDPGRACEAAAVRLFCDRVRAADRSFELTRQNTASVVALCAAVGGLPLGLERARHGAVG